MIWRGLPEWRRELGWQLPQQSSTCGKLGNKTRMHEPKNIGLPPPKCKQNLSRNMMTGRRERGVLNRGAEWNLENDMFLLLLWFHAHWTSLGWIMVGLYSVTKFEERRFDLTLYKRKRGSNLIQYINLDFCSIRLSTFDDTIGLNSLERPTENWTWREMNFNKVSSQKR